MKRIFISYRRAESLDMASRIHKRLEAAARLRPVRIFRDAAMDGGAHFPPEIVQAASQCDVMLVIIGRDWLTAQDADGGRRLDQAKDWVRQEVELGLRRGQHCKIIPILLDRVRMPRLEQLPPSLALLTERQGIDVDSDTDFEHDMRKVIRALELPSVYPWVIGLALLPVIGIGAGVGYNAYIESTKSCCTPPPLTTTASPTLTATASPTVMATDSPTQTPPTAASSDQARTLTAQPSPVPPTAIQLRTLTPLPNPSATLGAFTAATETPVSGVPTNTPPDVDPTRDPRITLTPPLPPQPLFTSNVPPVIATTRVPATATPRPPTLTPVPGGATNTPPD
ncbi:MAG: TIR domain-containing protein [bacterium]|nr:TIR domain-containing protein [bacterium]